MMFKERECKNITCYDVILAGEVRGSCEYDVTRDMYFIRLNPPNHEALDIFFGATGKSCQGALTNLVTDVKSRVNRANEALLWLEDLIIKDKTLA
ncbi:MAG: hypothetical protein DDT41_01672 [candidate division WS2 bacterium]|nr:hypothetical protein [Candidatus Psychracetigena formicireducens]